MLSKRFVLALFAFAMLMPLSGCGCRKSCSSNSSSFAPPPSCCNGTLPPSATVVPPIAP
jgi:hypothetical protein